VGGGQLDRDALLAHCAGSDDAGCGFFGGEDVESLQDLDAAAPDPRAVVAVALAPGLAYSFGDGGAGLAANVPTLVMGGTRDGDVPYEDEIRPVFEALPGSARLLTLTGAAHFGFSDLCGSLPLGGECAGAEEGYMDIERVHALSRTLATAWLRAIWRGEPDEARFLEAASVQAEGDAIWEP
jgi:predicted dienelactone hydrolase